MLLMKRPGSSEETQCTSGFYVGVGVFSVNVLFLSCASEADDQAIPLPRPLKIHPGRSLLVIRGGRKGGSRI